MGWRRITLVALTITIGFYSYTNAEDEGKHEKPKEVISNQAPPTSSIATPTPTPDLHMEDKPPINPPLVPSKEESSTVKQGGQPQVWGAGDNREQTTNPNDSMGWRTYIMRNPSVGDIAVLFLIGLLILLVIILIIRELVCWYWKINKIVQCLESIESKMDEFLKINSPPSPPQLGDDIKVIDRNDEMTGIMKRPMKGAK